VFDRLTRRAVFARLAKLRSGRILVQEHGDTSMLGAGASPALRVTVRDARVWRRFARGGALGAAEAWMDGDWTTDDLPGVCRLFVRNRHLLQRSGSTLGALAHRVGHALRGNSRRGSRKNIRAHYDLGNDFFEVFLDDTLTYSCGIFERPTSSLRDASIEKLDRICRTLDLRGTDHVLEIGTGWGSFAIHAASQYGCRVTTTTISREQAALARRRVREAGLADRITVLEADYRDLEGTYDKLVSIEMIEAVGHEFLDEYFGRCSGLLAADGAMLIQGIVMPEQGYARYLRSVDFIQKHVFPGSCLPSVGSMTAAVGRATDLSIVGLTDIGPHYATTLAAWRRNFLNRREDVRRLGYPERFLRMWDYYLAYCEAGFAERYIGTVQMTLAKPGWRGMP
jgi:cyclopropane-fatty-acyl-phospholipid synthase